MTGLGIVEIPSPNHDRRRPDAPIDILLLHYTGMASAAAALERLCDEQARVSSHYLIDEEGIIYRLVPEANRAFHAGLSFWNGERDINSRSIGIELVNPGHEFGYRPFPEAQMQALIGLAQELVERYPIPPERVLGHSDVAPTRKQDPGELFDWELLAQNGIGLWPMPFTKHSGQDAGTLLSRFGYETGEASITTASLVAFQRHFRPARIDGVADEETLRLLDALCHQAEV